MPSGKLSVIVAGPYNEDAQKRRMVKTFSRGKIK
jgi:hypothetical protein